MSGRSILLLGGSRQQVVAIERARELGFRTVLCDYLPDNPGQQYADSFHLVSTTDREAVLEVARDEGVSGVLAYSSDPASPTAGYVAEALGLPTNPLSAIEAMSEKHLFREAMRSAGLPCPASFSFMSDAPLDEVEEGASRLRAPFVVKPTDSSGSKGVTMLRATTGLSEAVAHASSFSRNGTLICEEFIQRAFPYVVGGDVFVVGGEVVFWGLMSCLRDPASPLVPVGKMTPPGLSPRQAMAIKDVVQRLVDSLGVRFGELNVEVLLGAGDVPYVLELGSRAGGNMIPVQLSDASGVDLVAANVLCAMGEDPGDLAWDTCSSASPCVVTHVLHSARDGIYRGYELSPEAEAACYRRVIYQEEGAPVQAFDGANKALGILFLRFGGQDEMRGFVSDPSSHVRVVVE